MMMVMATWIILLIGLTKKPNRQAVASSEGHEQRQGVWQHGRQQSNMI